MFPACFHKKRKTILEKKFNVGDDVWFLTQFRSYRHAVIKAISTGKDVYEEIKPKPLVYYFGGQSIENDTNIALFGPFHGKDTMIGVRLDDCYATKEELIQADKDFHEEIKRAENVKSLNTKNNGKPKRSERSDYSV